MFAIDRSGMLEFVDSGFVRVLFACVTGSVTMGGFATLAQLNVEFLSIIRDFGFVVAAAGGLEGVCVVLGSVTAAAS